jgi:two-component system NtrC family response regulator
LAEHFLRGFGAKRLSADAAAELVRHAWPGNVRELRNAMDRAAALARGRTLAASDLRFLDAEPAGAAEGIAWPRETLPRALARLEEMLVRRALRHSGGNRAEAARELGIHRQLLYAKLKLYGLDLSEDATQGVAKPDADRALQSK